MTPKGAWSELANVLEVQLEDVSDHGRTRRPALTRLAKPLRGSSLHDPDKAFGSLVAGRARGSGRRRSAP